MRYTIASASETSIALLRSLMIQTCVSGEQVKGTAHKEMLFGLPDYCRWNEQSTTEIMTLRTNLTILRRSTDRFI